MTIKKERADILLVEQGLFETREKAKRAIMAGIVYQKKSGSINLEKKSQWTANFKSKENKCPMLVVVV